MNNSKLNATKWPKTPIRLTPEQELARDQFMMGWHELLPSKYSLIETFNHNSVAKLKRPSSIRTLEIGAGLGEHAFFENLDDQEYHFMEYRNEFCEKIKTNFPKAHVICGDIEKKQPFENAYFDRIVGIHVLEHLRNLPAALREIDRLLKPNGFFDVVLPTEGGLAYSLARKISAQRYFEKRFKMDYLPIIANEHVSTFEEIIEELNTLFRPTETKFFPLKIPVVNLNLIYSARFFKKI